MSRHCNHVTWNFNLFQNGEPNAWDEHNMAPEGPMTRYMNDKDRNKFVNII